MPGILGVHGPRGCYALAGIIGDGSQVEAQAGSFAINRSPGRECGGLSTRSKQVMV